MKIIKEDNAKPSKSTRARASQTLRAAGSSKVDAFIAHASERVRNEIEETRKSLSCELANGQMRLIGR